MCANIEVNTHKTFENVSYQNNYQTFCNLNAQKICSINILHCIFAKTYANKLFFKQLFVLLKRCDKLLFFYYQIVHIFDKVFLNNWNNFRTHLALIFPIETTIKPAKITNLS